MASSLLHQAPPPTFNTLDAFQRARLIRSSRKLGAVLGTTPYLLEPTEVHALLPIGPTPPSSPSPATAKSIKASRRQGSIFSAAQVGSAHSLTSLLARATPSSSSISLDSTLSTSSLPAQRSFASRPRRSAESARDPPRPLVLQVNTVPVASTDHRLPPSAMASSSSPSSGYFTAKPASSSLTAGLGTEQATTPLTPSFRFRANAVPEVRRQRMAKLTRQLGENVPPELVFPHLAAAGARRRSMSVDQYTYAPTPRAPRRKPSVPALANPPVQPVAMGAGSWLGCAGEMQQQQQQQHQGQEQQQQQQQQAIIETTGQKRKKKDAKKDPWADEWTAEEYQDVMKKLRSLRAMK